MFSTKTVAMMHQPTPGDENKPKKQQAKPIGVLIALPNKRPGAISPHFWWVICKPCWLIFKTAEIGRASTVYDANFGIYTQHCHVCGDQMTKGKTPTELYPSVEPWTPKT